MKKLVTEVKIGDTVKIRCCWITVNEITIGNNDKELCISGKPIMDMWIANGVIPRERSLSCYRKTTMIQYK